MKWTKVDKRTGEPMKNGASFEPHDYVSGNFKIINNEFIERKLGWILTKDGEEVKRFNRLKEAKLYAEELG